MRRLVEPRYPEPKKGKTWGKKSRILSADVLHPSDDNRPQTGKVEIATNLPHKKRKARKSGSKTEGWATDSGSSLHPLAPMGCHGLVSRERPLFLGRQYSERKRIRSCTIYRPIHLILTARLGQSVRLQRGQSSLSLPLSLSPESDRSRGRLMGSAHHFFISIFTSVKRATMPLNRSTITSKRVGLDVIEHDNSGVGVNSISSLLPRPNEKITRSSPIHPSIHSMLKKKKKMMFASRGKISL
jgi:hypothetical protein